MIISKYHGSYNITRRYDTIKYIVVHYVGAGSSHAGNAKNNCIYFSRGDRQASAHYFIDDSGIWEYADPKTWYTWHCGDGHGKYGITNANSIGIEVCMNGDNPFTEKEKAYLKELVLSLMEKYNVPAKNVVRHYDASRKMCPYYYAKRVDKWEELKAYITGGKVADKLKTLVKKGQKGLCDIIGAKMTPDGIRGQITRKYGIMALQVGLNKDYKKNLSVTGNFNLATKGAMKKIGVVYGESGVLVRAIQCMLYTHGYEPNGIDGHYGNGMKKAVLKFQKDKGIEQDGSVGLITMTKLVG